MIKQRTGLFWLVQIIGWFVLDATIFVNSSILSQTYMLYSFFAYSIMGILVTGIYRWYLKRYVSVDWYGESDIWYLLIVILVCILVFWGCLYLIEYVYTVFWERTQKELEYFKQFSGVGLTLFSAAINILGWTTIYYSVKIYMQRNQYKAEQLELRTTLKEAQLNTLKGQVNPHFMFNSLNNIRGLMLEDVDKSREMIDKLSEMLQFSLSNTSVDAIALSKELEMVENYIALSKIQMEDRLIFKKDIDPKMLEVQIPPMIIQLLVENSAKHGIANLKNGGTIRLTVETNTEELLIRVTNTGKLQISKDSTQLGLKNIRQRLRLMYGKNASFSLEEQKDEVIAQIKILIV